MIDQIEQAVACVFNPTLDPAFTQAAVQFCEQLKTSADGWSICLDLFLLQPKRMMEARFFSLQVLERMFRCRSSELSLECKISIKQKLLEYIAINYAQLSPSQSDPIYIKNKLAQVMTTMFLDLYISQWTTFFRDFATLFPSTLSSSNTNSNNNHSIVDFFLRILLTIDEECVNPMIPRTKAEMDRNTLIKDTMRDRDIVDLTQHWFRILSVYYNPTNGNKEECEIVELTLKVIGAYIRWIDVGMIVNDSFMPLIYQMIQQKGTGPSISIRIIACEALTELVYKGMKPSTKLELIRMLNIPSILGVLDLQNDPIFSVQVAKLVNVIGVELCKCVEEVPVQEKNNAYICLEDFFQYLVVFVSMDDFESNQAVIGFLNATTNMFKYLLKTENTLNSDQLEFLRRLLLTLIERMKRKEDEDGVLAYGVTLPSDINSPSCSKMDLVDQEDEEEVHKRRNSLRIAFDAIGKLNNQLFSSVVLSAIEKPLSSLSNYQWRDVELALYLLYSYAEFSNESIAMLLKKVFSPEFEAQFSHRGNSTLLEGILQNLIEGEVSLYPHDSIPIIFFENANRYSALFDSHSELIPSILRQFIGPRGLHHSNKLVCSRVWYLFNKFIKSIRKSLTPYFEDILRSIQDLLVLPKNMLPEVKVEDDTKTSVFDRQLYLYETVGILIGSAFSMSADKNKTVSLIEAFIQPLILSVENILQSKPYEKSSQDEIKIIFLQIQYSISAVGSIMKGFQESSGSKQKDSGYLSNVVQKIIEVLMATFSELHSSMLVRNACRFTLQRLVPQTSCTVLMPCIRVVVGGIISEGSILELSESFPLLELSIHTYKSEFEPMLNELFSYLIDKSIVFLSQNAVGTDDKLVLQELRRSYLTFLSTLLSSDFSSIMLTERNSPKLESIIGLMALFAQTTEDMQTQKQAINVMCKMLKRWCENGNSLLPGFEQYALENFTRVCFELPLKSDFVIGEGISSLILTELSHLHRALFNVLKERYVTYLQTAYFPNAGCPNTLSVEYCQAIAQLDEKRFREYFQIFVQRMKSFT